MEYLALTLPGGTTVNPPGGNVPVGGMDVLAKVFANGLNIMLILVTVTCLIFLIVGGIQWINSGGDKQKIGSARKRITWAVVGLIVALASFFMINALGYFFNVNLLNVG